MKTQTVVAAALLWLLLVAPPALHAQTAPGGAANSSGTEQPDNGEQPEPDGEPRERRTLDRLGIIFNTPSILLELDEYQSAGIGLKAFWQELAARALMALNYESGREILGFTFGGAIEYHLLPNRVSPYLGGALTLGYRYDGWGPTTLREFELTVGPLFGVELAVLDGLSVFAEYSLRFAAAHARTSGAAGDESSWNYFLGTELGNQGSLGIVVYFLDRRNRAAPNGNDSPTGEDGA